MLFKVIIKSVIEDGLLLKKTVDDNPKNKLDQAFIKEILGENYPSTFSNYFSKTDFVEVITDLKNILETPREELDHKNGLRNVVLEFITTELAKYADEESVSGEIKSTLMAEVKGIISNYNESEVSKMCNQLLNETMQAPSPLIVIQSPIRLNNSQRKVVRDAFNKEYRYAYPFFKVNKDLLGGIKIFKDEELFDYSWSAQIASDEIFS